MNYRIRYKDSKAAEAEIVLEANSPTEAMVKFRCMHSEPSREAGDSVTSIVVEDADTLMPWYA